MTLFQGSFLFFWYYTLMPIHLAAQLIGFVALIISVSVFQFNKRGTILKLGSAAAFIYALHFMLLQAYTGAAMNIIGGVKTYTFYRTKPDKRHRWVFVCFIVIAAIATLLTWQGPISLLPLVASWLGTIALWQKKPSSIRHWALLVPPVWFAYDFIVGS
jgi:hypothetical protein